MPSAPDWLARQWPGGDGEAVDYLEKQGYTLTEEWEWIKPNESHRVTKKEDSAISYLIAEWDYGGIRQY